MEASEEFACTVNHHADRADVQLRGELDVATGPSLVDAITALTSDGLSQITIDLEHVTFIDSKGISALLESHRAATDSGMTLTVANLQPAVHRLFRISGVDAVLLDGSAPG